MPSISRQYFQLFLGLIATLSVARTSLAQEPGNSETKKFQVKGNAGSTLVSYNTNKSIPSRTPFSYVVQANMSLTGNGISLPFSFIFSEQERKFTQPFNQIGISPHYKWMTLHAGYRNLNYSKFSLGGHTFLGGGFDLTPGKLRISAMSGRFERSHSSTADSLATPLYERNGYSIKIGFGKDLNHVDLVYLTAKDNPGSLRLPVDTATVKPAENTVVGLNIKETILKNFTVEYDYGFSIYTDDIHALTIAQLAKETGNTVPNFYGIITPRINTKYFQAMEGGMGLVKKTYGIKLIYRRIDPGFRSMGCYEFSTDLENLTLNPNLNFVKKTVNVSGSIGYQHDNLTKKKSATSARMVGSANISINPKPHYGIALQYSNYSTNQSPGLKSINDTLRLAQVSNSISITPRYMLVRKKITHLFMVLWLKQTLNDNNSFTQKFSEYQTENYNFMYSLNINKTGTGLNFSYNISHTATYYGNSDFDGFSAGASQGFFKSKVVTDINFTFNENISNTASTAHIYNIKSGVGYRIKRNTFNITLIYLLNNTSSVTNPSFHETTTTFGYTYSF